MDTGEFFPYPVDHDSKSSAVEPLLHPIDEEAVIQYILNGKSPSKRPPMACLGKRWAGKPMIWNRTGQAFLSIKDASARLHVPPARIKKHLFDGEPLFGAERLVLDERDPYDRYYALVIDQATGDLIHTPIDHTTGDHPDNSPSAFWKYPDLAGKEKTKR